MDYPYIGLNMRDPVLKDKRVRQAIGYAIERRAIVEYCAAAWRFQRRDPAADVVGVRSRRVLVPVRSRQGSRAARRSRLHRSGRRRPGTAAAPHPQGLEQRIQPAAGRRDPAESARVGIELDVRTYEFATLFADVLKGNFQMYLLQWTGGAVADPDILRRVFHSNRCRPPASTAADSAIPTSMACWTKPPPRPTTPSDGCFITEAQRLIAEQAPYISLWCKTNVIVAQRDLRGIHPLPTVDFAFLKNVAR